MDTLELIELVKTNHAETKARHEAASAKADKALNELRGLTSQIGELEQKVARRGGPTGSSEETKSWGQQIVGSEEFKSFHDTGGRGRLRIEVKTVSSIGSGSTLAGPMIAPQIITEPTVLPRRRMTIRNLLAPGTTTANSVWFPRQTARQNNAAPVAELAQKPQSDFTMEQVQTPVVTIAHFMKAARQAMDDAPALMSLIDSELRYGLDLTEETELLAGDGSGQHLLGLLPQATSYSAPFVFGSGETALDRIALAILQSELAQLPANGIVLHPTDWMKMRLTKDADGNYILGKPSEQTPPVLWGLPVVPTVAISAGNYLVGAFSTAAQIFDRMSVEILISTEDGDNFQKNAITIRGESRLALAVKQPAALITGTLP